MKTIELMSTQPCTVRAIDRLDAAARAMWEGDCGLVPVVDGEGLLVGVVTDRDLCMASYTQGRALNEIPVNAVMARTVMSCRPEDPVTAVMHRMQELRVHRLPVVDARGGLVGVISTNDLVRAAHARPAAVDPVAVVRTLATIGAPRRAAASPVAAPSPKATTAAAGAAVAAPRKAAARKKATRASRQAAKPQAAKPQAAKPLTKGRARKKS